MTGVRRIALGIAAAGLMLALGGAQRPMALARTSGGLWEVDSMPRGPRPTRMCVADTVVLAQYEHRSRSCTRVVITDQPTSTVIHYTCPGSDFGRTKVTLITPRSLRIETQGISGGAPFSYVLQARRVGDC